VLVLFVDGICRILGDREVVKMDVFILPMPTCSRAFRTRRQSLIGTVAGIRLVLVLCVFAIEITTVDRIGTPALSSECTGAGIRLVRAGAALVVLIRVKPCQVGMDSCISTEQAKVGICRILGDRELVKWMCLFSPYRLAHVLSEPDGNS